MKCSKLLGGCEVISEGYRENRSEQGKKARGARGQEVFGTFLSRSREPLVIFKPGGYKTR